LIKKIIGDNRIIPVVMFHSIGMEESDWVFSHISEPVAIFQEKIFGLSRSGYNFTFWEELYQYMSGKLRLPLPAIMLTFDDGYLDNWVYAFPILKKYGAKATIFVNPEFVDPSSVVRPNLEDVWEGRVRLEDLEASGFLSWEEMRLMEKSGIIDIQSHSLTHTWYFCGPKLIDFHKPNDNRYPWMFWNQNSDQKPFYLTADQSDFIFYGTPIYEYEKALVCRRYFPPTEITDELTGYVNQMGGADFFSDRDWNQKLTALHSGLMDKCNFNRHFETEQEYSNRVLGELKDSKQILEENLNKEINYISWPGGGYNDLVLELALRAGYKSWTLGSRDQPHYRNVPGSNPRQVKRIGSGRNQYFLKKDLGYSTGRDFVYAVKSHHSSLYYWYLGRLTKAMRYFSKVFTNLFQ
jgi:peptidoglycan/xylan/chitin deacetylase (PgdA/CDA1 family)